MLARGKIGARGKRILTLMLAAHPPRTLVQIRGQCLCIVLAKEPESRLRHVRASISRDRRTSVVGNYKFPTVELMTRGNALALLRVQRFPTILTKVYENMETWEISKVDISLVLSCSLRIWNACRKLHLARPDPGFRPARE